MCTCKVEVVGKDTPSLNVMCVVPVFDMVTVYIPDLCTCSLAGKFFICSVMHDQTYSTCYK